MHYAVENGSNVNERQKIQHYRIRSTEERIRRKIMPNRDFFKLVHGAYVNCAIIAMLYTHIRLEISSKTRWWCLKCVIVCVPSVRYPSICNVLHLWRISRIPTYRVDLLYDSSPYFVL